MVGAVRAISYAEVGSGLGASPALVANQWNVVPFTVQHAVGGDLTVNQGQGRVLVSRSATYVVTASARLVAQAWSPIWSGAADLRGSFYVNETQRAVLSLRQ